MGGTFGTSVEDRVRMIERNNEKLVKGQRVYVVTFERYDPLYDKVHEMSTLPTHDRAEATAKRDKYEQNPHYKNVVLTSYIHH